MRLIAAILGFALSVPAYGDAWAAPVTRIVQSDDGNIVVRIDPVKREAIKNPEERPVATITKWDQEKKSYDFFQRVTLRKPLAPRDALITNDARFLITFEDHFGIADAESAIAIYDLQMGTVHTHRLADFLPAAHRERLLRSDSIYIWRRQPRVQEWDHTVLVPLAAAEPGADGFEPHIVVDPAKNRVSLKTER